jgi:hypothetical protein
MYYQTLHSPHAYTTNPNYITYQQLQMMQQPQQLVKQQLVQQQQLPDADNDDIMLTDRTDNPQPTKVNSRQRDSKPSPVFVYGVTNFYDMITHLSAIIEDEQYHCKEISNDKIKIYVATPDSYRKLIKHLQEDKIIYHTHQTKQERAYRTVIRNLQYSTPTAQITAELEKQGHKVRNILNVKHRITKEPLSLFFIDLEPHENNKGIHDMEFLCNMKITVEAPRPKKAHRPMHKMSILWSYCAEPYACVKCGGNHNTTICTKTSNTPAKCSLCGGNDPASYKG